MKALVLEDYMRLVHTEVADPRPGHGEVLVAIKACGICGSDVHGMDGSTGRRRPPIIMGHEAAGEIAEVGEGVRDWQVGERVTFDSTIYCGDCDYCREGRVNLCDNRRVLGVSCDTYRQQGCFAELVSIPQRILYHLPDTVSFEHASLVEPAAVALHAVKRSGIRVGETALVIGAGIIGQFIIQMLRAQGTSDIHVTDIEATRVALAVDNGARVWEGASPHATLEGGGFHHVFDAVGIDATLNTAMTQVQKGGHVTLVGNIAQTTNFPLQAAVVRELTVHGSCAINGEYKDCIQLIERGKLNLNSFISHTAPLSEGSDWFQRLYNKESGVMKVILQP